MPVPDLTYLSNSIKVLVFAAWTNGQDPDLQMTLSPGELWLFGQYAAAAYCSIKLNVASSSEVIARKFNQMIRKLKRLKLHTCLHIPDGSS